MFPDTLENTIWTLRNALKKNKVPIWKAVIKQLSRSRSNRREVNIGQLAHVTKDKEVVVVPGKILGSGEISHKLTLWCFTISEVATRKILDAGGKILPLDSLIKKYPDGKGVRIIG
ncbi:MAG TPA: 50S ribosomal protein L18e [Nitrososphaeraceae archaeon]|nr:50S ribosomal protein L18e [Nitrososphaeraceae archaeon]